MQKSLEKSYTGKTAEIELRELILNESLDENILPYILPKNRPHAWESVLWDYKRDIPNTSGKLASESQHNEADALIELIKDCVAFHNSYGGYIVFGIDQHEERSIFGCSNFGNDGFTVEKLNQQLLAYTKTKIFCKFRVFKINVFEEEKNIGILLVPMRDKESPVVVMTKGSPEREKKPQSFKKGDIFVRIDDECRKVQADLQGLQFACSLREIGSSDRRKIEANLPAPDPDLIRFVGRADYLLKLWNWLTSQNYPLKTLTALGGTGKTAIAYEFCKQMIASPPAKITKVVWLTAKKKLFPWFLVSGLKPPERISKMSRAFSKN